MGVTTRFSYNTHDFSRLAHHNFCQSSEINRAAGDIERHFAPMSDELIKTPEFQHLLSSFAYYIDVDLTHRIIDVHQIRVTCNDHTTSSAAPEGIHQDGFEFVGIYCVQRKNICGGFTQLFTSPVDQHPHLNTVLEESQFIIINDRHFYHFISETLASTHGEQGVRDVFVFTA
ncbi:2OG-Fe dioxygenase family protein [Photobacterium damselae]|uniref:2OG-Fe dioxygenase family protein n=1 Tax=Photobacterium damselae TaxID=38293 RepID=UPI0035C260EC